MTRCAMDDYLGAYVLDALDDDERAAVSAHLAGCSECAEEVACLAGTVSRLARLTLADVEHALPVPAAGRAGRRRVGGRVLAGVAAAAACAAIATAAVGTLHGGGGTGTVIRSSAHARDLTATLVVGRRDTFTAVHLSMQGTYPAGPCYLVAHSRKGLEETAASWVSSGWGTAQVNATTTIAPADLAEFDVVTASGHQVIRLVMAPPAH
ncbi:MAG TPA: zf-HC2 domain-containing protein [Jatrophihabitans sp.]|nr:zf-HC2 domain-containing protein [Jatrophihabitans sp.]